MPSGTTYRIAVTAQPVGQVCTVSNASGTVASAAVSNVAVSCSNSLNLLAGAVSTLAGNPSAEGGTNGTGSAARFVAPFGVTMGAQGNLFVGDSSNGLIRKIAAGAVVTTIAGSCGTYQQGTGTLAAFNNTANVAFGANARFNSPNGMVVGATGHIYVADSLNHSIRKISPAGVVSTVAGADGVSSITLTALPTSDASATQPSFISSVRRSERPIPRIGASAAVVGFDALE